MKGFLAELIQILVIIFFGWIGLLAMYGVVLLVFLGVALREAFPFTICRREF